MLVVLLGVYLQSRASERLGGKLAAQIETLRAEIKQQLAEFELRLTKQILELVRRIERLEESRGLIRNP